MADQVDTMSDAELRTKLAEHGYPVMPITASTRKLLVKKLKLVMDNKSKPRNNADNKTENRRSLARYSSGEESDIDNTNIAKEKKTRRATTASAMLPPTNNVTAKTIRKSTPTPKNQPPPVETESDEEKSPVRTHEEVETVTTRRVTRTYAAPKDGDDYETGSDSDVDSDRKSVPVRNSSRSSDYISSTLPTNDASTSPPRQSILRPSVTPSFTSSADHLNSIRSRLGLSPNTDRPSSSGLSSLSNRGYTSSPFRTSTSSTDEIESPYLSNFTRRLSALKADPPRTSFADHDVSNGPTLLPRRSYITGAPRTSTYEYKTPSEKKFLKNNLVPFALIGIAALFFFGLFFMYMVKRNDITSIIEDQSSVIPICNLSTPKSLSGINCVSKERVPYAKELLKKIHSELTVRAAAYKCGKSTKPFLTQNEIVDLVKSTDPDQCLMDLYNLQVLLVNNEKWGISVVEINPYSTEIETFMPITNTDTFVRKRNKDAVALTLTDPSTPISCVILNTLYSAGSTIILVVLLSALAIGSRKSWQYYKSYQKRKSDEIYSMVEQIIDIISQETEDSGEPYISIDHVRDTLILPQNREKMSSIWDAAVKFIQKNESRVRMEVQSVDGEDCRVWRWISPHGSPRQSAAWQGQAFETQEGSVNNLTISPTPCLKIRHMFDKNDTNPNLVSVVQDVILEKCGDNCNILHVDIERVSCCVYVKCASENDAGVVYRNLHGWWYEGRLITVKYLRLERYMQRFPNSPSMGPYLKPSRARRN